jgi:hypothetical protein
MTPTTRKQQFDALFESIPGKNIERIRRCTGILFCKENTVRQWRMVKPPRIIPAAKLAILQRELAR